MLLFWTNLLGLLLLLLRELELFDRLINKFKNVAAAAFLPPKYLNQEGRAVSAYWSFPDLMSA